MKIYGVIDLRQGQVVHGIAGQRASYQPVRSRIAPSSAPADVARAFATHVGLQDVYVADLDAIGGAAPDWPALEAIAAAGLELLVDAGCGDLDRARQLASRRTVGGPLAGIVVGLESLTGPDLLPRLLEIIGADRAVFSLDLRGEVLMATAPDLQSASAEECGELAWQAGFRRLIVLDVAAVGRSHGPATVGLCGRIHDAHPWRELISGGGIRHGDDIAALAAAGCDSVLIASALHQGEIDVVRR